MTSKTEKLEQLLSEATAGKWVVCNITNATHSSKRDVGVASVQFPGHVSSLISTSALENNAELICLLRNNTQAIIELVEAAENYERFLPTVESVYSEQLVCSLNLRIALAKIKEVTCSENL